MVWDLRPTGSPLTACPSAARWRWCGLWGTGTVLLVLLASTSVWAQEAAFPDPHLRAALAKSLGAPLTPTALATATTLDLGSAGITDLRGLEGARAVERLDIRENRITNLSILADLPALREVRLGGNPVSDFSPVAPLVRAGLLVFWRPDTPGGLRTVRVETPDLDVAAKTGFLLDADSDPAEDAARGYIKAEVSDAGLELALRTGFRVVVVGPTRRIAPRAGVAGTSRLAPPRPVPAPAAPVSPAVTPLVGTTGIPGFPCYRTVEETYASAQALATTYPHLAEWSDTGDSWKKTQNSAKGYDLMVLRLTNEQRTGTKPRLFITSSLHPREYTTAELTTRFAEQLVAGYGGDADTTWLLDHHEVHLLLHVNPDGHKRAETGLLWRKNHNTNHCPQGPVRRRNGPGVDLNRNFDFRWDLIAASTSTRECATAYRGPSAASEPETQAVAAYMAEVFADTRGPADTDAAALATSGIYLDIHSYGGLVLYPWHHTANRAPNGPQLRTLGRKLARFNGYHPQQGSSLYVNGGTTAEYAYGIFGVPSYTYEIGTTFFQDCRSFEQTILPDNLKSLRYALKVVREPYVTPAGPDTVQVATGAGSSPATAVPAGTTVTLSATFDDTRYSSRNGTEATQPIAGGEYYMDSI